MLRYTADMQNTNNKKKQTPIASELEDNGIIIELTCDHKTQGTALAVWDNNSYQMKPCIKTSQGMCIPYRYTHPLIKHKLMLLPEQPEEFGTDEDLVANIRSYLHKYVDISPSFELLAAHYILVTWVYDAFPELPYLRVRGDFGSGKTRFLKVVGSICYRPLFASGASTVSPIFHMLDSLKGTLIVDEADFRFSDATSEMIKILNNGNVRGFPVLRCQVTSNNSYEPRAFNIFGPKIVATRGHYEDRALESRFLTEDTGLQKLREDIPVSLPNTYASEAQVLRNKLLMYRFRNYTTITNSGIPRDLLLEPRINQMFAPLLHVAKDESIQYQLLELAREFNEELKAERGMDTEARVLLITRSLQKQSNDPLSIKRITNVYIDRFASDSDMRITTRFIGTVIRKQLGIKTRKSNGVYIIPQSEHDKLQILFKKYDV